MSRTKYSQYNVDQLVSAGSLGCQSNQCRFMLPFIQKYSGTLARSYRSNDPDRENYSWPTSPRRDCTIFCRLQLITYSTLDIIDRCQPPSDAEDPRFGLTSWTICTQTDFGIMNDGFRSFFSGHSSCTQTWPFAEMAAIYSIYQCLLQEWDSWHIILPEKSTSLTKEDIR